MALHVCLAERNNGATAGEIAKRYGISTRNVYKYLDRGIDKLDSI